MQHTDAGRPWRPAFLERDGTARLVLSCAISDYDHVRDLTEGRIRAEGIALLPMRFAVEEIFFRFVKFREWEVSELSFAKYVSLRSQGDESIVGIPVFPSRVFRHSSIYVRADGPVTRPEDLAGRRVGVPEWAQTAAVYSRGALARQFGVDLRSVHWVQAGVNEPGRAEKVALALPEGLRLERRPDSSLDAMLLAGELDAVLSAHPPRSFLAGDPRIRRLFPEPEAVEREFLAATGVFPIMHLVGIRAEVVRQFPWVCGNLLSAFEAAKQAAVARAREFTASRIPFAWAQTAADRAAALMGGDPWPYGIEPNRTTLDAFCAWAHEQGVAHRRLRPEELFPPEVQARFRI
ncbi:MAG: ABC transporter substrate-binding protein [Acetobacteraceae bacterium]|nr:ABC transporter substrate-binding protein [Acetobacteraceae bacterium]MCX7685205.1 ABC transporter substrate-binding protein [Acetobacteraceae bacterium]MDW8397342.1 ABC transporter substrate-binding protein [Acetobacteraceae bacterium]